MDKKTIRMSFKSIAGASDYGNMPLDFLISKLNESKVEMEKLGLSDLSFDVGDNYINLYGYRLETDAEFEQRIKREIDSKNYKETWEKKMLKELIEKYGIPQGD
jgi:hypothetical protein